MPLVANSSVNALYQHSKETEPALILVPQAPKASQIGAWAFDAVADSLIQLLDEVVSTYDVDKNRIYICGLSNGGAGTWHLLLKRPDFFAAAVPICGYLHKESATDRVISREMNILEAKSLKHLPIWLFHAEDDEVVTIHNSRQPVKVLQEVGNKQIHYTEYATGMIKPPHCCWDQAFATPELLPWLFKQSK